MITIGKRFTFEAAHIIEGHCTCGVMHGHTWTLDVMIKADDLGPNGMLVDFKVLGGIVKDLMHRKLDHKYLNDTIGLEMVVPTTAETLAVFLAEEIRQLLFRVLDRFFVVGIRLQEGPGGWAEYWTNEEVPNVQE